MNQQNLQPFQKGYDSRRQNGRKKGSKNISTIIRDLLDTKLENITNEEIKDLVAKQNSRTIKEAIISVAIKNALKGDLKTSQWLVDKISVLEEPNEENLGFFDSKDITITIVDPKHREDKIIKEL